MKEFEIHRFIVGGCGGRVHAFLGVLSELEPILKKSCHHYVGTSAGSIIATLLALKCKVDDILEQERKHPFEIAWSWVLPAIWRLIYHQDGILPIEYIQQHIRSILVEMIFVTWDFTRPEVEDLVDTRLTFQWLHQHLHRTLEVQAMDRNRAEHFIFNHKLTPDVLLVDAITASCAIPWAFSRFVFRGKVLCDAAVFSGLPWASIQCDKYLPVYNLKTGKYLAEPTTVGVCLTEESPTSSTTHVGSTTALEQSWFEWIRDSATGICTNHIFVESEATDETPDQAKSQAKDHATSIPNPCVELFSLPIRLLHNHEKSIGDNESYIIQVKVDPNVYGSKLHSLWPAAHQKQNLFEQGVKDARDWLKNIEFQKTE